MASTLWIVRYLWLIPALARSLAAGIGALLKQGQRKFAATLAIAAMSLSFVLAVVAFAHLLLTPAAALLQLSLDAVRKSEWVSLGWVLDPLAAVMLVMVTLRRAAHLSSTAWPTCITTKTSPAFSASSPCLPGAMLGC